MRAYIVTRKIPGHDDVVGFPVRMVHPTLNRGNEPYWTPGMIASELALAVAQHRKPEKGRKPAAWAMKATNRQGVVPA